MTASSAGRKETALPASSGKSRQELTRDVIDGFPFRGYMEHQWEAYDCVTRHCSQLLSPGSRILDYGCGPCDKTAVLSHLGHRCWAVDDLQDDWHLIDDNAIKIQRFADAKGIVFRRQASIPAEFRDVGFDMTMAHDVIEHFSDSPREFLLEMTSLLNPGGYLYLTVPNAVNLRKRLLVLAGETNYPRFPAYYWSSPTWRGHKREYVLGDLRQIAENLGLRIVRLQGDHHRMSALGSAKDIFKLTLGLFHGLRDTLTLIAQRPEAWQPRRITPEALQRIYERETAYRYDPHRHHQ